MHIFCELSWGCCMLSYQPMRNPPLFHVFSCPPALPVICHQPQLLHCAIINISTITTIIIYNTYIGMSQPKTKVLILSFFYILFAMGFGSFNSIVTKIWESTGDTTISPMYFTIKSLTLLITNTFTSKLAISQKWQMVLFTVGFALNCSTGFLMVGASQVARYFLAVLGAMINGVCIAFMFTCQGSYIHKVCVKYGVIEKKGEYYGIFASVSYTSSILSALVVLFGLTFLSHYYYFILVTAIVLGSAIFCWLLVEDVKLPAQEEVKKPSMKEQLQKMWKFYPTMKYALGYALLNGITIAVHTVTLFHLFESTGDQHTDQQRSGFALLALGIGSCIGAFLGGKLCDLMIVKKVAYVGHFAYGTACLLSIIVSLIDMFPVSCLACLCWGFTSSFITANEMVICSKLFEGKYQAFAVVKQFHSVSLIIYYIVALITANSIPIPYLMLVLLVLALPSYCLTRKLPEDPKQSSDDGTSLVEKEPKVN